MSRIRSPLTKRSTAPYHGGGYTIAEFIPRQVMHLRQILDGFPLISGTTVD